MFLFKVYLNYKNIFILLDTMVIPKILRERVEQMTQDEIVDLFLTGRMIATKIEKHLNGTSINFAIQDGAEAGQSVKVSFLFFILR